jgi:hypothetical protein
LQKLEEALQLNLNVDGESEGEPESEVELPEATCNEPGAAKQTDDDEVDEPDADQQI